MSFKTKKISTEPSLSERLKNLRLQIGLSRADLSQALRVQAHHLKYLEKGEYHKLPASIYVKSFLSRYADFFKLSFKDLWQLYQREKAITEKLKGKSGQTTTLIQPVKSLKPLLTPKILLMSLATVLFLSLLIYFSYQVSFLIRPPQLFLFSPAEDLITWESQLFFRGQTTTNAQVLINDQPIRISKDGFFEYSLVLAQGMNQIYLKAENPFGKKTEILRRVILNN